MALQLAPAKGTAIACGLQAARCLTLIDEVAERSQSRAGGQPLRFVSASLGRRRDLFPAHRGELRVGARAARVELGEPPLRVRTLDVAVRSRVLLRTDPAVRSDVED